MAWRRVLFLPAVAGILALTACGDWFDGSWHHGVPPDEIRTARITSREILELDCDPASSSDPLLQVEMVRGVVARDAGFVLYAPAGWRDLVEYAHGYVSPEAGANFDFDVDPGFLLVRDSILCAAPGRAPMALAASDYGERGFAVKEGAQRTRQAGELFASVFGQPRRRFAIGTSLGGAVTLWNIERFPERYSGGLPMCGFVAGSARQLAYIADLRVAFDVLYRDQLPQRLRERLAEHPFDVASDLDFFGELLPALQGAIVAEATTDPATTLTKALALTNLEQVQLPVVGLGDPVRTMISSLATALFFAVEGAEEVLARSHGRSPIGNDATRYAAVDPQRIPPELAPLQDAVLALVDRIDAEAFRFSASRDAANYLDRYFTPTGDLRVPVVTLHTTLDPAVPYFHEAAYAELVTARGASGLLAQLSVERYGHCAFTRADVDGALTGLVRWSEGGARPHAF